MSKESTQVIMPSIDQKLRTDTLRLPLNGTGIIYPFRDCGSLVFLELVDAE
jgi:hypothetical protein